MPSHNETRFRVLVLLDRSAPEEEDGLVGVDRRGVDDLRVDAVHQEVESGEETGVVAEEALGPQFGDVAAASRHAERPSGDREDSATRMRWDPPNIRPHGSCTCPSWDIGAHATSPPPPVTTTF